jgi:hypothetical protein
VQPRQQRWRAVRPARRRTRSAGRAPTGRGTDPHVEQE